MDNFTSSATCLLSDSQDPMFVDSMTPAPGQAFSYLARGKNGCPGTMAEGSAGPDSNGVERIVRSCP